MFIFLIYIFILRIHIYINNDLIINYFSEVKQKYSSLILCINFIKLCKLFFSITNIEYIFQKYSDIPVLKADEI